MTRKDLTQAVHRCILELMNASNSAPRHPIRVVAQRTGLTPATIRAWERRYAAVSPSRSDGGRRLYSDREVERLGMLRQLTEAGRPISMVAPLSDDAARELLLEDRTSAPAPATPENGARPSSVVDRAYAQMLERDAGGLERTLWLAAVSSGSKVFLDEIVRPLLVRMGEAWASSNVDPGREHLASDVIDGVLARIAGPSRASEGPGLVVATLPGERHGLGARLLSAAATVEGWRVSYLGTDLPATDIATMAVGVGARAVAISVVGDERLAETLHSLAALRELLAPNVEIWVGGRSADLLDVERLPRGVRVLNGLEHLRLA